MIDITTSISKSINQSFFKAILPYDTIKIYIRGLKTNVCVQEAGRGLHDGSRNTPVTKYNRDTNTMVTTPIRW